MTTTTTTKFGRKDNILAIGTLFITVLGIVVFAIRALLIFVVLGLVIFCFSFVLVEALFVGGWNFRFSFEISVRVFI